MWELLVGGYEYHQLEAMQIATGTVNYIFRWSLFQLAILVNPKSGRIKVEFLVPQIKTEIEHA